LTWEIILNFKRFSTQSRLPNKEHICETSFFASIKYHPVNLIFITNEKISRGCISNVLIKIDYKFKANLIFHANKFCSFLWYKEDNNELRVLKIAKEM